MEELEKLPVITIKLGYWLIWEGKWQWLGESTGATSGSSDVFLAVSQGQREEGEIEEGSTVSNAADK